ncbi:MAG: RimK/LysX family protein [Pseudomonadota bacterium]
MKRFTSLLAATALFCASTALANDKVPLGWLEFVVVEGADLRMDAKLDTGAKTSSIHAEILSAPDRKSSNDDEDDLGIVVFRINNEKGDERTIESGLVRWAAIKKKSGGVLYRPVVEMDFCIGGNLLSGEVTLADRGHFNYEVLVGRNMLEGGNIIVDASEIYTDKSRCS